MFKWPIKETNEIFDKSFEFDWVKGKIFRQIEEDDDVPGVK